MAFHYFDTHDAHFLDELITTTTYYPADPMTQPPQVEIPTDEKNWLTATELADVLDLRTDYIRSSLLSRLSERYVRRRARGRQHLFYARAVMELWAKGRGFREY